MGQLEVLFQVERLYYVLEVLENFGTFRVKL